jgi:arylsulfatase A-like enzyme
MPPLLLLLLALLTVHCTHSTSPPNIILLLADDVSVGLLDLSLMPNLRERVVNVGVSFANAVAATPLCGPSRASLLSGRFAHNSGYTADETGPPWHAGWPFTITPWAAGSQLLGTTLPTVASMSMG